MDTEKDCTADEINKKILFVNLPSPFLQEPLFVPSLALLYLSAALKSAEVREKPETRYLELSDKNEKDSVELISSEEETWKPKIIAFTATTPQYPIVREIAKTLKRKEAFQGVIFIIGGVHATNYLEEVKKDKNLFDYIFTGECEDKIVRFWSCYISGKLEREDFSTDKSTSIDINKYPIPDWEIDGLELHQYNCFVDDMKAFPVLTSRGCDCHCAFCEKNPKGERRNKNVEFIESEIRSLNEKGISAFVFYDCCLILGDRRLSELEEVFGKLKKDIKNFRWRAFLRANTVNIERLRKLKDLGCSEIGFGIESGSDSVLSKINKGCTVNKNTKAIRACKEVKIKSKIFLMLGLPGETKETIEETRLWVEKTKPDHMDISIYMPFNGSDIADKPKKFGIKTFPPEFGSMYYKGRENLEFKSFVETGTGKQGLTRKEIEKEYIELREFRKEYIDKIKFARNVEVNTEAKHEVLEVYKLLSNHTLEEGELIWKQLGLFISLNSLFIISLGFVIKFDIPLFLMQMIASLGALSSFVWILIYNRSWANIKVWFYLLRKQEFLLPNTDVFLEGALLRRGKKAKEISSKNWKLNWIQRRTIRQYMSLLSIGFLAFWLLILLKIGMFFDEKSFSLTLYFKSIIKAIGNFVSKVLDIFNL